MERKNPLLMPQIKMLDKYIKEYKVHLDDEQKQMAGMLDPRIDLEEMSDAQRLYEGYDLCDYTAKCDKLCLKDKQDDCRKANFWDKWGDSYLI